MSINPGEVGSEAHRQTEWNELWLAASVSVSDDIASNLMYEGAWGVETLSSTLNPHFLPRLEDEPARTLPDVALQEGWEWLVVTFSPDTDEADARELASITASEFGTSPIDWFLDRFEYRRDADWLHRWKRYFKPIQLSDQTWICPSWEEVETKPGSVVIKVDPGLSFGTGQHPTTKLCLQALESNLPQWSPNETLDVGCGSGILSIALALWGQENIIGLDIDPASPEAFSTNATLNNVVDAAQFDTRSVDELDTDFSLVVANIIAPILLSLSTDLVQRTKRGGILLLSGILKEQVTEIIEGFSEVFETKGRNASEPLMLSDSESAWRALWWKLD